MLKSKQYRMVDVSGQEPPPADVWDPVVIPKQAIDDEIKRLCKAPMPANGWRSSNIVHPQSKMPGLGLAPGISVTINVLLPGESSAPIRRNSNQVEICNLGSGVAKIGDREIRFAQWDVWTAPSMQTCVYVNDGSEPCARLSYSNAPLLEKLEVHYIEENPKARVLKKSESEPAGKSYTRRESPRVDLENGSTMLGYESLVDIEVVPNPALHWPWKFVRENVAQELGDNKRSLMLFYNPATERRNGTTHSFFATIGAHARGTPEGKVRRGHRHSSAAINYYFLGGPGRSIVEGKVFEWDEGDLMLSAPGWAEHAHYFPQLDRPRASLTVQDHPLQIGMESLIWQEDMDGPILALGSEAGVTGYVSPREKGN